MPYTTRAELEAEFTVKAFTGVTDALWAQALLATDAMIDVALNARYTVPFSPVPEYIRNIAIWISRWTIQNYLGYDKDKDSWLKDRYDQAIKQLERLSSGRDRLVGDGVIQSVALPVFRKGETVFPPEGY